MTSKPPATAIARPACTRSASRRRGRQRGISLVEVMVVMAIVALLSGGMFIGMGGLSSGRLRESSTLIAGAIRVAYNHASATSNPTRLVFDFEQRTISLEESRGRMLVQRGDRTGGAAAATEAEQEVVAESAAILEGPRAPRAQFTPVKKLLGFDSAKGGGGVKKSLRKAIYFRQVEVSHDDEPVSSERAYLYFWPGGQTERAAIQLQKGNREEVDDNDVLTITVAPLTGRVRILGGPVAMKRPRTDEEASEREDSGF